MTGYVQNFEQYIDDDERIKYIHGGAAHEGRL